MTTRLKPNYIAVRKQRLIWRIKKLDDVITALKRERNLLQRMIGPKNEQPQ